ncbi:MAG TPA: carboxypeptidase-like regulatory domain-containing protein [Gammaproteobacteria bacterium]
MRKLLWLLVAWLCVGCAPVPHYEYFAPAVSGTLVQGGHPLSGAKLLLRADSTATSSVAYSDAAGHFVLAPLREYHAYISMSGDQPHAFSLTITVDGKDYPAFQQAAAQPRSVIHLDCDLSAPLDADGQPDYCKWAP